MFFGAINVRSGLDIGQVVDDSLIECRMTHKEAWIAAGYRDGAEWSRAIQGARPLDLHKLAALPDRFQFAFIARYAAAQAKRIVRGLVADRLRMARTQLAGDTRADKVGA